MAERLRPMSTAPKDGTRILTWFFGAQEWGIIWWAEYGGGEWQIGWDTFKDHELLGWLPLPEPPIEVECD